MRIDKDPFISHNRSQQWRKAVGKNCAPYQIPKSKNPINTNELNKIQVPDVLKLSKRRNLKRPLSKIITDKIKAHKGNIAKALGALAVAGTIITSTVTAVNNKTKPDIPTFPTLPPATATVTAAPTAAPTIPPITTPEVIPDATLNNLYSIENALNIFSKQIGEDGLYLIDNSVDMLGNNRVETADVVKLLYIISGGKVYNSDDSSSGILTNKSGTAFGPFQITKSTGDFVNQYYGTYLDIKDPYDNLETCILYLRYLRAEMEKKVARGEQLLTGDDINAAVIVAYHDGKNAKSISKTAQNMLDKYNALKDIDNKMLFRH